MGECVVTSAQHSAWHLVLMTVRVMSEKAHGQNEWDQDAAAPTPAAREHPPSACFQERKCPWGVGCLTLMVLKSSAGDSHVQRGMGTTVLKEGSAESLRSASQTHRNPDAEAAPRAAFAVGPTHQ